MSAIDRLLQAISEMTAKGTSPIDRSAEVVRIEDGKAWVHIDNGYIETPADIGINCNVGDKVKVRMANGEAYIIGNDSRPPTDDAEAHKADAKADNALKKAYEVKELADDSFRKINENAEYFAEQIVSINGDIEDLQEQIDGNITSWFYNVDPAMNLPPVTTDPSNPDHTGWDTDEKKNNHLGDLYYNVDNGKVWRFVYTNGAFSWSAVEDSDVTRALEMASRAQDTADSKRRVFVTTPVPPYDVGDLWVQGSNGDIKRCAQAKTSSGTYSESDWINASKYTDDSALTTWIAGDFADTIADLEDGIIDAKVDTYYQTADPSTNWTAQQKSEHTGDLWYNSTSSVQKYYRWNGTTWQELTATPPNAVFDSIDGKATIYTGSTTPANPSTGDLWLKSASDDILTYVNGSWIKYNKYTNDARANEAYNLAHNTEQHFWTKNGTGADAGAYITEDTQDAWESSHTGGNIFMRSTAIKIRNALVDLAEFTGDGLVVNSDGKKSIDIGANYLKFYALYNNNNYNMGAIEFTIPEQDHYQLLLRSGSGSWCSSLELNRYMAGGETQNNAMLVAYQSNANSRVKVEPNKITTRVGSTDSIVCDSTAVTLNKPLRGSTEDISLTSSNFTTTTGTFYSAGLKRFGNTMQMNLVVTVTSTVTASHDLYEGTFKLENYRPQVNVYGSGYYGAAAIIGILRTNGTITLRVTGSSVSPPQTGIGNAGVSFTYLI